MAYVPRHYKYCVLKNQDIKDYLSEDDLHEFNNLCMKVDIGRRFNGKSPNEYLVVNMDEPYAQEVVEVMRKYGVEPFTP